MGKNFNMNKRKNPRIKYIIVRVTPLERQTLKEEAIEYSKSFSIYIRNKLGLKEKND